jgi:hypothetical protein
MSTQKCQFDPEALDASMRIGNHYILFGKIPSGPGMAEMITACYGPTLAKSKASVNSLVVSCLRMAGANTLLRHQLETCLALLEKSVSLLDSPAPAWHVRVWNWITGYAELLRKNDHLDDRNDQLEGERERLQQAIRTLKYGIQEAARQ